MRFVASRQRLHDNASALQLPGVDDQTGIVIRNRVHRRKVDPRCRRLSPPLSRLRDVGCVRARRALRTCPMFRRSVRPDLFDRMSRVPCPNVPSLCPMGQTGHPYGVGRARARMSRFMSRRMSRFFCRMSRFAVAHVPPSLRMTMPSATSITPALMAHFRAR